MSLAAMCAAGYGRMVFTSSINGLYGKSEAAPYSTAKAGVIHMSRVAAAQLSPQGIRVNAICPGLIATSIFGASMGTSREVADQIRAQRFEPSPGFACKWCDYVPICPAHEENF